MISFRTQNKRLAKILQESFQTILFAIEYSLMPNTYQSYYLILQLPRHLRWQVIFLQF